MQIVKCSSCKKEFGVRVRTADVQEAKEAEKTNIFLVAKCPECNLLTRFKAQPFDVKINISEGTYIGKMEVPAGKPDLN